MLDTYKAFVVLVAVCGPVWCCNRWGDVVGSAERNGRDLDKKCRFAGLAPGKCAYVGVPNGLAVLQHSVGRRSKCV